MLHHIFLASPDNYFPFMVVSKLYPIIVLKHSGQHMKLVYAPTPQCKRFVFHIV